MGTHVIDTSLTISEQRAILNKALESYSKRFAEYSPRFDWRADALNTATFSCEIKGVKVKGQIVVLDKKIEVQVEKLPGLASFFEKPAVNTVREEVDKWVQAYKSQKAKQTA